MAFGNYYGMGYHPGYFTPTGAVPDNLAQYKGQYQSQQQSGSGLIWVQGEAGAKSFLVAPGQSVLLMDSEAMQFYIKSADSSGMPLPLRVFRYNEVMSAAQAPQPEPKEVVPEHAPYMTRDEVLTLLDERLEKLTLSAKKSAKSKEDTADE